MAEAVSRVMGGVVGEIVGSVGEANEKVQDQ